VAWYPTKPSGSDDIRDMTPFLKANWVYLQSVLPVEHTFPGSYGTTAGKHTPGECRILYVGVRTDVDALSSPPLGALAYATDEYRLLRHNSSAWVTFSDLVHPVSGGMTGNLTMLVP